MYVSYNNDQVDFDECVQFMDDEIRENCTWKSEVAQNRSFLTHTARLMRKSTVKNSQFDLSGTRKRVQNVK